MTLPIGRVKNHFKERGIELLIGIAVYHPRGRHHGDGAPIRIHDHQLASCLYFRIIESGQFTSRGKEQRHAIQVVPSRNRGRIEHALMRPPPVSAMADVVDKQRPLTHLPVDGVLRFGIALTTRSHQLRVSVHANALDVESPLLFLYALGMSDAVNSVPRLGGC